jgi:tetratricopeptide (TPR) repeat protein
MVLSFLSWLTNFFSGLINNPKVEYILTLFLLIKFGNALVYQNFLNYFKVYSGITFCFFLILSTNVNAQNHKIDSLRGLLINKEREARADILYELGYEFIETDNQQALKYASDSYGLAKDLGDSLRMVKAILIRGSALRRIERLDEAIKVSLEGLNISRRNRFSNEFKILLNSIAIAYSFKAEYDKALDFHYQSLIIREELGNKFEISIALNNIGFVYF